LSHPHICPLYDVGHQDGIDFMVMEYLEGETLAHRLKKSDALRSPGQATGLLACLKSGHARITLERWCAGLPPWQAGRSESNGKGDKGWGCVHVEPIEKARAAGFVVLGKKVVCGGIECGPAAKASICRITG
jgi:hypothetical protein